MFKSVGRMRGTGENYEERETVMVVHEMFLYLNNR